MCINLLHQFLLLDLFLLFLFLLLILFISPCFSFISFSSSSAYYSSVHVCLPPSCSNLWLSFLSTSCSLSIFTNWSSSSSYCRSSSSSTPRFNFPVVCFLYTLQGCFPSCNILLSSASYLLFPSLRYNYISPPACHLILPPFLIIFSFLSFHPSCLCCYHLPSSNPISSPSSSVFLLLYNCLLPLPYLLLCSYTFSYFRSLLLIIPSSPTVFSSSFIFPLPPFPPSPTLPISRLVLCLLNSLFLMLPLPSSAFSSFPALPFLRLPAAFSSLLCSISDMWAIQCRCRWSRV